MRQSKDKDVTCMYKKVSGINNCLDDALCERLIAHKKWSTYAIICKDLAIERKNLLNGCKKGNRSNWIMIYIDKSKRLS